MATNIGNINFGIDANTKGLRNAVKAIDAFQKKTMALAKSQEDGAKKAAKARLAQERAIKRAFQATLKLTQALRLSGAPAEQISRVTRAFGSLTKEMTATTRTQDQVNQSMDRFTATTNRSRRALVEFNAQAKADKVAKLNTTLRNLESASVLAVGPLSGLGARIRSLGAIAGRSSLFLVGMFAGVTALVVGFAKLSQAAVAAGRVFETSMARFKAASGSIEIARKQMGFVIKTANTLGLRIDTSAKAFSRLTAATRGTSLEGEGARRVFLAVSKAAAALRLGAGEVEGTFRAIEQIMSKGSVQAEELRGQLGERLPGAFRIAAESMGVTTMALGKMLKNGEVLADDFLPKFAAALEKAFGDTALDNVNSLQGSMNLLANEGLLFAQAFNQATGVSQIFVGAIQAVTSAIRALRTNLNAIIATLGGVTAGLLVLAGPAIFTGLVALGGAIRNLAAAMFLFNFAIASNPLAALAKSMITLVAAGAAAVAAFFGIKSALDSSTEALDELDTNLDAVAATALTAGTALGQEFKTVNDEIEDLMEQTFVYVGVLNSVGRVGVQNVELLVTRFEVLQKVMALSKEGVSTLAGNLIELGSGPIAGGIEGVAEALFRLVIAAQNTEIAFNKLESSKDVLEDAITQLATMQLRLQALREGQDAVDFFDDITTAVMAFNASFKDTNITIADRLILQAAFTAALIETRDAEKALDDAEKARLKNQRETERQQKRFVTAVGRAVETIDILRARLKALSEGPDSFEVFTKVTEKVMKFRNQLERAGKEQAVINALTAQYQMLLEQQLQLTDRFARAGKQMASAITNSLEDIIVKGGSVKDMLHNLAQELFRVMLRALFLDQLQASLGSGLTGGIFPAIIGAGAGATTTPGGGKAVAPPAARGLNFEVPGSGGGDTVPVGFFAKPGEVVSVQRPDQAAARSGGGVVITQINNFNGSTADPATLIPILEENNRKLKGEILDGFDRGSFN